jgi:hypothetical protein
MLSSVDIPLELSHSTGVIERVYFIAFLSFAVRCCGKLFLALVAAITASCPPSVAEEAKEAWSITSDCFPNSVLSIGSVC